MQDVDALLSDFDNLNKVHRKAFLSKLINQCDPYDLHILQQSLLKQGHGPFDILSSLPTEVAQRVMSYLDARDLCRCQQVCKSWRLPALDPELWRRQYNILTRVLCTTRRTLPALLSSNPSSKIPTYHALYRHLYTRDRNWARSRPQYTIPLSLPNQKVHAVRLRDPYLAVVYASPQPELWVYDLGKGSVMGRRSRRERWWWPSVDTFHSYNDKDNKMHTQHFRTCFSAPLTQKAGCVDLLPEKGIVAVGTYLRECHVWTTRPHPHLLHTLRGGHVAAVTHVALNAKYVATGGYDRTVVAWSLQTGEKVAVFDALAFSISGLTLHPAYHHVLLCSGHDGTLESFDISDDALPGRALGTNTAPARMLFFGPRPRALAAMCVDSAKGGWGSSSEEPEEEGEEEAGWDDDDEPLPMGVGDKELTGLPTDTRVACFWYDTVVVYRGDLLGEGSGETSSAHATATMTATATTTATAAMAMAMAAALPSHPNRPPRPTVATTINNQMQHPSTPPLTPSPPSSISSSSSALSTSSGPRLRVWEARMRGEIVAGALCGRRVVVAADKSGYFAERTGPIGNSTPPATPAAAAHSAAAMRRGRSDSGSSSEREAIMGINAEGEEAGEVRLDIYSLDEDEISGFGGPGRLPRGSKVNRMAQWKKDRPTTLKIGLEDVMGVEEGASNARIRQMEVDEERVVVVFRGGSGVVVGFGER
ncbi:WD40-repeat-containing domain protein [Endogone sp. FLAS-F59071]|nr:WD40-repeat-containing domain protein [Endogone sp. FLAS-F59071]|eukprot:RUS17091.1 WD40-repeat-containing domain protein [Endogone sp. FLAS-F59071]